MRAMPRRGVDGGRAVDPGVDRHAARLPQRATRRVAHRQPARDGAGLHVAGREEPRARRHQRALAMARGAAGAERRGASGLAARAAAAGLRRCARKHRNDRRRQAMKRILMRGLLALLAIGVLLLALVWWLNVRDEDAIDRPASAAPASPELIARGAYLARAGNCMGCHTAQGGAAYAGGRGVPTPFGTIYEPNLTPDLATGIGAWSASEFWRPLHNGRAADGRLLYPAFPYPNYTRITREDSDAIHAYLRSLAPVHQPNLPHDLRFPFDQQAALAVWRALYFR